MKQREDVISGHRIVTTTIHLLAGMTAKVWKQERIAAYKEQILIVTIDQ